MSSNERSSSLELSSKRRARLRMIGIIVLALGICSASLIYWMGTRSQDLKDDLSMVGYDKAQSRQMGQLYGKWGLMIDDLLDDLKRPGTQAIIIAGISALVSFGCFKFNRQLEEDDKSGSSS